MCEVCHAKAQSYIGGGADPNSSCDRRRELAQGASRQLMVKAASWSASFGWVDQQREAVSAEWRLRVLSSLVDLSYIDTDPAKRILALHPRMCRAILRFTANHSVRKLFNAVGLEIYRISGAQRRARTSIAESYALLSDIGFRPSVVIDVGVGYGTPELYESFPDSFFLLAEPLPKFEPALTAILKRYRGCYVLAAIGARSGIAAFNVHDSYLQGSSLYKEAMGPAADGTEVTVPMRRLDEVVAEKALSGPYLLKVDVQGAELDVLEGGRAALQESEVVVLEVSMFEFGKGQPQFFDVVSYMKQRGFVAFDIIIGWNRPLDNALGQIDIAIFVKEHGQFRQNHAYAETRLSRL